jgi:hypothetical protein
MNSPFSSSNIVSPASGLGAWSASETQNPSTNQRHDWFAKAEPCARTLSTHITCLEAEAQANQVDAWAVKLLGHLLQSA